MAFSTHDQVPDSPTNTFATLNPIGHGLTGTLAEGNLKYTSGNQHNSLRGNFYVSSGKWYWEVLLGSLPVGTHVGISSIDEVVNVSGSNIGNWQKLKAIDYFSGNGRLYYNNTSNSSWGSPFSTGDIIGVYLNMELKQLSFYKNNQLQVSPIDLTSATYNLGTLTFTPRFDDGGGSTGGDVLTINFGQDHTFGGYPNSLASSSGYTDANGIGSFYYQPPTGALALCTANLPDPDIDPAVDDLPEDYFKAVIWSGTGGARTLPDSNSTPNSMSFNADLIWIKARNQSYNHTLFDSVRGFGKKHLFSDLTSGESANEYGHVSSITGNQFSVANGTGGDTYTNNSSTTYCAWCWKAGGAPTADNTATSGAMTANSVSVDGTLQSSYTPSGSPTIYPKRMSVNTKAGFSIIKYTGTGSAATVPHGLSAKVEFSIVKALNSSQAWSVYHKDAGGGLVLNLTNAAGSGYDHSASGDNLVSLASGWDGVNGYYNYIMYAWHSVAGYSAFGSYTGNGSTDGPFVFTGFKPAWVMIKRYDTSGYHWMIYDNERNTYNPIDKKLYANDSTNTVTASDLDIDFLSNGFKVRGNSLGLNSTGSFIYAAFAEMPFRYSATNAR